MDFNKSIVNSDILTLTEDESIKQHLKFLLNLNNNDFAYYPNIGCNIRSLLFENFTQQIKKTLERIVSLTVEQFEPRIKLETVNVSNSNKQLNVSLTYYIVSEDKLATYTIFIKKVR